METDSAKPASQCTEESELTQPMPQPLVNNIQNKKAAKKAKKKVKLTVFDGDAMKLIRRSNNSAIAIASSMGVDANEVRKRLLSLERQKIVVFDAANPDRVSLTVKGYNEYCPSTLETSIEKRARKHTQAEKKMMQKTLSQQLAQPQQLQQTTRQIELPHTIEEEKIGRVDLGELIARGAPKTPSFFVARQQQKNAFDEVRLQPIAKQTANKIAEENCELCKDAFSLAVNGGNPKFGHCFCGAAYHRDCYGAMMDGDSRCLRCGRELELEMDRKSVEALKQLKDAFE